MIIFNKNNTRLHELICRHLSSSLNNIQYVYSVRKKINKLQILSRKTNGNVTLQFLHSVQIVCCLYHRWRNSSVTLQYVFLEEHQEARILERKRVTIFTIIVHLVNFCCILKGSSSVCGPSQRVPGYQPQDKSAMYSVHLLVLSACGTGARHTG